MFPLLLLRTISNHFELQSISDSLIEFTVHFAMLFYFIFNLFMVSYFGNEIKLKSDRLSYSLFESNWIDQPQSTKRCVIIFAELLKQQHELIVGKIYPLTLQTFTRVYMSYTIASIASISKRMFLYRF